MENENKITILQALKRLRDDIIKWVTNNLRALSKKIDDHNEDTSAHQDIRDAIITDYNELENKPIELSLVFEEKEIDLAESGWGVPSYEEDSTVKFIAGQTYKVLWNGTELYLTAKKVDNALNPVIGNLSLLNNAAGNFEDSGEPILITTEIMGNPMIQVYHAIEGHYTLEIYKYEKLEDGYLPTSVTSHLSDKESHIKNYADLPGAPSITEEEPGKVVYVDPAGNIIAQIDGTGLETANVTINKHLITGVDLHFSDSSTNPIQNKIITEFLKNLVSFDPQDPTTLVIALPNTVEDDSVS